MTLEKKYSRLSDAEKITFKLKSMQCEIDKLIHIYHAIFKKMLQSAAEEGIGYQIKLIDILNTTKEDPYYVDHYEALVMCVDNIGESYQQLRKLTESNPLPCFNAYRLCRNTVSHSPHVADPRVIANILYEVNSHENHQKQLRQFANRFANSAECRPTVISAKKALV